MTSNDTNRDARTCERNTSGGWHVPRDASVPICRHCGVVIEWLARKVDGMGRAVDEAGIVTRDLEQAEARLEEARVAVDTAALSAGLQFAAYYVVERRRFQRAAIEVGRLRALAEHAPLVEAVRSLSESSMYAADFWEADEFGPLRAWAIAATAALAAREEVQG